MYDNWLGGPTTAMVETMGGTVYGDNMLMQKEKGEQALPTMTKGGTG
jgi:hypothetical protein